GVSCVDLTLIHWPDTLATIEEQARNLEALVFEGLTRHIGVSNFTGEELETARQALKRHDIVVNQVKYSILDKSVEEELLPYVTSKGITIQAYTPLERGEVLAHKTINEIARKRGKTTVQVALNYLISRPRVIAIPKAEKSEHVREIAGAMGWRLPPEDIEVLEAI
ncbi:MAG: aldo/keto reductase, partial [Acidilobaceae archaeon]